MGEHVNGRHHQRASLRLSHHHPGGLAGRHSSHDRHGSRPMTHPDNRRNRTTRRAAPRGRAADRCPAQSAGPGNSSTPSGEPVGIVDDLEIEDAHAGGPAPAVTALSSPGRYCSRGSSAANSLGSNCGQRHGISSIESARRCICGPVRTPAASRVEHWLRDQIIGRIPGGNHAAE